MAPINVVKASEATGCTLARDVTWVVEGTQDNVILTQNELAWSDGYKISSQILQTVNGVVLDSMTGACVVYMPTDTTFDVTNGVICHQATIDAVTITSMGIGGHSLFVIPGASWIGPGSMDATNKIGGTKDWEVTLDKYGLVYSPV